MKNLNTIVYAQGTELGSKLDELLNSSGGQGADGLAGFVNAFISFAFPLSIVCLFLLLTFSAYKLMTSQGNPEKLKDAREEIGSAIMGFIFIVLSVFLLALLGSLFDINIRTGY